MLKNKNPLKSSLDNNGPNILHDLLISIRCISYNFWPMDTVYSLLYEYHIWCELYGMVHIILLVNSEHPMVKAISNSIEALYYEQTWKNVHVSDWVCENSILNFRIPKRIQKLYRELILNQNVIAEAHLFVVHRALLINHRSPHRSPHFILTFREPMFAIPIVHICCFGYLDMIGKILS